MVVSLVVRKKLQINNTCELVVGGDDAASLYMKSTSKNQFFANREMFLGFEWNMKNQIGFYI